MPAPAPTHFFRREVIDLVLADDSGFRSLPVRRHKVLVWRNRRQRRRLRARSKCCRARDKSKGEFQKVAAFHDISLFAAVK